MLSTLLFQVWVQNVNLIHPVALNVYKKEYTHNMSILNIYIYIWTNLIYNWFEGTFILDISQVTFCTYTFDDF